MKPELRPISITIVDFLGVFLPGTVWLVLLATFCHFILENFKPEITPIWEIKNLLKSFPSYSSILLLLFSIIIGYLIKPVSTPVAEFCYSIPPYLWKTFRCNLSDNGFDIRKWVRVVEQNDFKLPFTKEHKKDKDGKEIEYYKFIVSLINTNFKFENKINELDSRSLKTRKRLS